MLTETVCCIRRNRAISHAYTILQSRGLTVSAYPTRSTGYLLLPVPSFPSGSSYLEELLPEVSRDTVICGGGLDIPLLRDYRTVDFLKDPYYLADNAAITADCALKLAEEKTQLHPCPVLILGWGRIGKCLAQRLRDRGSAIAVAARKDSDLAMIHALGFRPVQIRSAGPDLTEYRIIFNTVPAMVLPKTVTAPDCVILELASTPGMAGDRIINARGLPGKLAPEASGQLIADTFIRLVGKEVLP